MANTNTMPNNAAPHTTDIAIIGAGPIGLSLAHWLLRDSPWHITLIDSHSPVNIARHLPCASTKNHTPITPKTETAKQTQRALALSAGSRLLLEELGVWPHRDSTAIHTIHVSQRHHFGRTLIQREDYAIDALGHVVTYTALRSQLEATLLARATHYGKRFNWWHNSQVMPSFEQSKPCCSVTLSVKKNSADNNIENTLQLCHAGLVIHAEGTLLPQSTLASAQSHQQRDYQQTALIGTITCDTPKIHWAWERFTAEGPLALLPLGIDQSSNKAAFSLVWVANDNHSKRRLALHDDAFLSELNTVFGQRLGKIQSICARQIFPLRLRTSESLVHDRHVFVGNAAQTLHPVAGQGFNLGLRDAWSLAHTLRHSTSDMQLAAFAQARQQDRQRTIAITDLLPRVFCSPCSPLKQLLGLGIATLDAVPPVRHMLAKHMMFGYRR